MIITRTPLRISLAGGGSDMPEFYTKEPGAVVSFAIDKYVYVSVNEKFDGNTRVSYSQTENVKEPKDLEHDLVREALLHWGLKGLEINSVSDIPGEGSGLGSSSSFTVGLCKALLKYQDRNLNLPPGVYAEAAYHIERERCAHYVGKQDHYAAAYGGIHFFEFRGDNTVTAELLRLDSDKIFFLERDLMLFWTGKTRKASPILEDQAARFSFNPAVFYGVKIVREMAYELREEFRHQDISQVGRILHDSWHFKQAFSKDVTDYGLNQIYERAIAAGADGGKLCGAGGGGFFLFACHPDRQRAVEKAVGLRRVPFRIVPTGSEFIYRGTPDVIPRKP